MADEKGPNYDSVSPQAEEEVLLFWKENKIFEKSLEQRKQGEVFVFYEGPPYANGLPGIHHVESRSFKDIILRYKTMRGYYAPRKAGWDTHGLPTEMAVEKELGINSKREIEEKIGVEKFVQAAKKNVFFYKEAWEKLTERMAYWLDLKNAYVTMTNDYIESLWSIVAEISKKGLLYEDYRVLPWCPRCGTSLSSHELAMGYKKVKENSIYVKFKARGEEKTYFLVWTTTPWTLPGNVALAVNPDIDYIKIKSPYDTEGGFEQFGDERIKGEVGYFILSKEAFWKSRGKPEFENLLSHSSDLLEINELDEHEDIKIIKGKDLIGFQYEPLYKNNAPYKVVAGDFVSTEDGSGIVHIAPAFGGDDLEVGRQNKLPTLITVSEEGKMLTPEKSWDGKFIKDADPLIVKDLKERSLLFKTEMYEHDYPFCWRCQNPLMYYAKNSWFFKTTAVKEKMLAENTKIDWRPAYLRDGRFGEWLKENVDWGISRERYWGTPLPIWRCKECKTIKVIGSLGDLDDGNSAPTTLFVMRHGEAVNNVEKIIHYITPEGDKKIVLTEKGKKEAAVCAKRLKEEGIEVIISSPSVRAKETAEIVARELGGLNFETMPEFYEILISSDFSGKDEKEYHQRFATWEGRFSEKPGGSENWRELRARAMKGLAAILGKYRGKKILLVSHGDTTWIMMAALSGLDEEDYKNSLYLGTAEFKKIMLHNWPYNSEGELDLHKPYVDEIKLKCPDCSGAMRRVSEVIDVWFDSGAMPFAGKYYPKFYPADYISEAIDQTRGWFYTLLAVSSLLGLESSYKRVLSLGLVLDEKGEKMSKSKGNVVDPIKLIEKHGADAVRWYFYTINQPWDDKLFRERDIQDASRRFLMILWNSFVYWKTYSNSSHKLKTTNYKLVINQWFLTKWNEVLKGVTEKLEKYDIVSAARELEDFVIDDISHWYIRRIREHMKNENSKEAKECSETLGFVLLELSKTLAPFTPFIAEGIYKGVGGEKESVHLEDFPNYKLPTTNYKLLKDMERTREIVSKALEARQRTGIKIRQPLELLRVKGEKLKAEFLALIQGEINVKRIEFSEDLLEETMLDTAITPELREEGLVREFIRQVQDFRKELKLKPQDKVLLSVEGAEEIEKILEKHGAMIKKEISISGFEISSLAGEEKEIQIDGKKLKIGIQK